VSRGGFARISARAAGAGAVLLFAVVVLAATVLRHPVYTPDGIVYARYAARDAGLSERDATLAARAFYEKTPLASSRYRSLVELEPSVAFQRSRIFENRLLYPAIVSVLYHAAGFRALFIVSALSYVGFAGALYWLLCAVGRPWTAAIFTIVALAMPLTRDLAAGDLTDMLAALWWTLALGALLHAMNRPHSGRLLATLALASVLLALTRPAPYLIVLPAFAAAVVQGMWPAFLASLGGVAAYGIAAQLTHAFGVAEQLRWVYDRSPDARRTPYAAWYRAALESTIRYTVVQAVRTAIPVLALGGLVFGIVRREIRPPMIVLAAAALSCLAAIPFNPVPSALARVVLFPLVPVMCAIFQTLVAEQVPA
jgi:hypothetical protein